MSLISSVDQLQAVTGSELIVLTILHVFLGEGDLAFILQVKPLNAPPDQVLPARLHGGTEQTGVKGRDLTCTGRKP